MCVSLCTLQKIPHSCSWGKRPVGFSAKKPAYISSVSKALNVWVKNTRFPPPQHHPAVNVCLGLRQGDGTAVEFVTLKMRFVSF